MQTGSLRNSISVVKMGGGAVFVGVMRKSAKGINLAELHEYGSKQFTIKMTPKMRRFMMKAMRLAGIVSSGSKGGGGGVKILIGVGLGGSVATPSQGIIIEQEPA